MEYFTLNITTKKKQWYDIFKEHQVLFTSYPKTEILFARLCMENGLSSKKSQIIFLLKGVILSICSSIPWKTVRKASYDFFAESFIASQNDWGIIKGIVLELSSRGYKVLLRLSERCRECYEREINNKKDLYIVTSLKKDLLKTHVSLKKKIEIIKEWNQVSAVAKEYKLCSFFEFYYRYLVNTIEAKTIVLKYMRPNACLISLGGELMGFIHQEYDMRHFVFQHGAFTEVTLQHCAFFSPAVASTWMVFGEHMGQMLKKYYDENYVVVGSSMLKRHPARKVEVYDIIFFSNPDIWNEEKYHRILNRYWKEIAVFAAETKLKIALKPKHTENPNDFLEYIKAFYDGNIEIIDSKRKVGEVLSCCKAAVSVFNSTVAIESVINGTISFTPILDGFSTYDAHSIPYIINDFKEIEEVLNDSKKVSEIKTWQAELVKKEVFVANNTEEIAVDEIEKIIKR